MEDPTVFEDPPQLQRKRRHVVQKNMVKILAFMFVTLENPVETFLLVLWVLPAKGSTLF